MISVKIAYSAYIASRINQSIFLKQNKKPKFVKLHLKKEKFGIFRGVSTKKGLFGKIRTGCVRHWTSSRYQSPQIYTPKADALLRR